MRLKHVCNIVKNIVILNNLFFSNLCSIVPVDLKNEERVRVVCLKMLEIPPKKGFTQCHICVKELFDMDCIYYMVVVSERFAKKTDV